MNKIRGVKTYASTSTAESERERRNRGIAYRAALEGIVLLKNNNILPMSPGPIALFGAGAERTIKGGTGSGEVNERYNVTIRDGLSKAGFAVTSAKWLSDYDADFAVAEAHYKKEMSRRILKFDFINILVPFLYPAGRLITQQDVEDSETDTCIYVVARQSGEGEDRKLDAHEYTLNETEYKNIEFISKAYKNTIVVINVGPSFDCSFCEKISGIGALVHFSQQGMEGGTALADILSGKHYPSGHLSDTWARSYDDIPFGQEYAYLNGNVDDEYYKEGIYVGYRYFDSFGIKPLFPFGYGLGYTTFSIGETTVEKTMDGIVRVSTTVTNTGGHKGKEVVQIYVEPPQEGSYSREKQMLAAFAKTKELQPQESDSLVMDIDFRLLGMYDEETASTVLPQGDYIIKLGCNSADTTAVGCATIPEPLVLYKHKAICKPLAEIDELRTAVSAQTYSGEKITLTAADLPFLPFTGEDAPYHSPKADELLNAMSPDELVDVVVGLGLYPPKEAVQTPGATGNTTAKIKGYDNLLLADGPAGLRLQRASAITKRGKVKMIDAQIDFLNYAPKLIKKFMFGNPKKDTVIYQYTSAFPVGNAQAQTWNPALIEEIGDAVGTEMDEYGITFWLAPSLNIHRNPLCGRNYEYYSEDPYLSGKMAAAAVKGIQKHKGRYVTLKHYTCNNQESNRDKTNANLSVRALREIYLKGFAIAVTEGRPGAVMSSYNKVNGTYTSNSYDLCTEVLRKEWGFDGIVVSDWFSNSKKLSNAALSIKSGNDLIMPGTSANKKTIKAALKDGSLSLSDLKRCASRVLGFIAERR
jgi:beta-glucosidase